jgi:hypothetical protein
MSLGIVKDGRSIFSNRKNFLDHTAIPRSRSVHVTDQHQGSATVFENRSIDAFGRQLLSSFDNHRRPGAVCVRHGQLFAIGLGCCAVALVSFYTQGEFADADSRIDVGLRRGRACCLSIADERPGTQKGGSEMKRVSSILAGVVIAAFAGATTVSAGPEASIQTEYLMTLHAPLDPPQAIDQGLLIFNVQAGGWVEGARIKGKLMAPAADWLRVMPSGVMRLDVRGTIQTDDGELIYVTYGGAIQCSKEQADRLNTGQPLKTDDCYFITAPTFQTKSDKYAWLNAVQAVGKMISLKVGEGGHVRYDIFAVK